MFLLCERSGIEVVLMEAAEDPSLEAEWVQDVLEIITVFSARLGGPSHSTKNLWIAFSKR